MLPDVFADMVRKGELDRIILPSPLVKNDFKTPRWFQKMMILDLLSFFQGSTGTSAHDHPKRHAIDLASTRELADDTQSVLAGILDPGAALIP